MGKPEDELSLPVVVDVAETSTSNVERECRVNGFFKLRCLLVLFLGIAVFLSAAFWLPPFLKHSDPDDPDLDPRYRGHDIVASFKLEKPKSVLEDNIAQLEGDILDEIEFPNTEVVVLYLKDSPGSNITDVVFGVDPETKYSSLSPATLSLIRSSFESLVTRQSSLQLTTSLFGEPYFFEVLKFPGGITVTPRQKAFPLQKSQISFNFTLNFCIYQIQENFDELRSQLKSGLHLAPYENLYISLTNSRGSTVAPPATVQTSVVLAVGIPSKPRLKQLAQTIKDSHGKNLGLNHTVFGKVKQVSLSSILQHSLGESSAPAPAPMAHSRYHHHHHHHHHHHCHHHHQQDHDADLAPRIAPSTRPIKSPPVPFKGSPAPERSAAPPVESRARPPGCRFGLKRKHMGNSPEVSAAAPVVAPKLSPRYPIALRPSQAKSPASVVHQIPSSSPLPHVVLAHVHPPSSSEIDSEPPDQVPSFAPYPSPSAAGSIPTAHWLIPLLIVLLLHP